MSTDITTGASRRPLTFSYLGRPASLYIDAMSKRRAYPVTSASAAVISAERPVAVVTGAGRGIGRLLARRLSDAGYAVALVARSQQELRETARLTEISGGRALCLPADVTDEQSAPEVIRRVETELGPIELLINNAGILGPTGPMWEVDLRAWWRTVHINLFGALVYTRLAMARMVPRQRGRIVNITSQAGAFRWPTVSAYSVSKAAVIKLTENLAIEARRHGISIFSIHPGLLPIGLAETALSPDALPGTHDARACMRGRSVSSTQVAEPNPIVPSNRSTVLPPDVTTNCPDATSPCTMTSTRSSAISTTPGTASSTCSECTVSPSDIAACKIGAITQHGRASRAAAVCAPPIALPADMATWRHPDQCISIRGCNALYSQKRKTS